MAYRFQDLQGNWRMRYDDGTTSLPINADDLGPQDRTSTIEVNDEKGMWRNSYGVDTSFAGSRFDLNLTRDPSRIGAEDGDRQRELANAIIDGEMSKNRIATYTSEFKPLAEMHSTQDVLIKSVASNVSADPEARAGAFQALYPGMQVTVGQQGILQFQAARSDLGFSYPDKVKAEKQQRQAANPALAQSNVADAMTTLNTALTNLQQATDENAMGAIMGQAASTMTNFLATTRDNYRAELYGQYPIAALEQELQESVLNDNYWKNVRSQQGTPTFGESDQTKGIRQQLAVFEADLNKKLEDRLAANTEVSSLQAQYSVLQEVYKSNLSRTMSTPQLLPEGIDDKFGANWNADGSVWSPQQRSEFADKLSRNDAYAMKLAEVANGSIPEMLAAASQLGPVYSTIVERVADKQLGETGAFKRLKDDVLNFEQTMAKAGVNLSDEDRAMLEAASPAKTRSMSDTEAANVREQVEKFKVAKIINVWQMARDIEVQRDIIASKVKPPEGDGYSADLWTSVIEDLKRDKARVLENPSMWDTMKMSLREREAIKAKQREAKANPEKFMMLTIDEVLRGMGSRLAAHPDLRSDSDISYDTMKQMAATMTEWLGPQLQNPDKANLLGAVKFLRPEDIQAAIFSGYEVGRRSIQRQNF